MSTVIAVTDYQEIQQLVASLSDGCCPLFVPVMVKASARVVGSLVKGKAYPKGQLKFQEGRELCSEFDVARKKERKKGREDANITR